MFVRRPWRGAGVLVGHLADVVFADPVRGHPVAGFGRCAAALERVTYRDSRAAGALHVAILLGALALLGATVERGARRGPALAAATAAATWVTLGGTTLARTGTRMADLLDAGDVDGARALLPSLCGRDPSALDADGLARAALESVAENTSDAQVAPLLWAAAGGVPGCSGVPRRQHARRDDRQPLAAVCPIRLGCSAIGRRCELRRRRGWPVRWWWCAPRWWAGRPRGALRAWRRDAARHPSPNAGVVEATFAGALGVRLGGPTQYRHELEIRPTLGDGRAPQRRGPAPGRCDCRGWFRLPRAGVAGGAQRRRP